MTAESFTLSAVRRDTIGRTPEQVRRAGYIPAVLYGHGVEAVDVAIDGRVFGKLLPKISSSTLMTLTMGEGGENRRVLLHAMQRHPLTGKPVHMDFYQVKLTEKIKAKVPLEFVGVSSAVKDHSGTLVKSVDEVEVEALPQDLPDHLEVDISKLATFEDRVRVEDLKVSAAVQLLTDPTETIATVTPPRTEEELKELETVVEEKIAEVKTEAEEKKAAEEAKKAAEGEETGEPKKGEPKKEEKK